MVIGSYHDNHVIGLDTKHTRLLVAAGGGGTGGVGGGGRGWYCGAKRLRVKTGGETIIGGGGVGETSWGRNVLLPIITLKS